MNDNDKTRVRVPEECMDAAREQVARLEAQLGVMREALGHASDTLDRLKASGHDGDEESGEHAEDCPLCDAEAAIAHLDAARATDAGKAMLERLRRAEQARGALELARIADAGDHAAAVQQSDAAQARVRELEGELASLRELISGRPAMDRPTLYANVEKAIHAARDGEKRVRELEELVRGYRADHDDRVHEDNDLLAVAEVLAAIADRYDANGLDDEARKFWGKNNEHENMKPPKDIVLFSGRGGRELLTLADCLAAREAVRKAKGRTP